MIEQVLRCTCCSASRDLGICADRQRKRCHPALQSQDVVMKIILSWCCRMASNAHDIGQKSPHCPHASLSVLPRTCCSGSETGSGKTLAPASAERGLNFSSPEGLARRFAVLLSGLSAAFGESDLSPSRSGPRGEKRLRHLKVLCGATAAKCLQDRASRAAGDPNAPNPLQSCSLKWVAPC